MALPVEHSIQPKVPQAEAKVVSMGSDDTVKETKEMNEELYVAGRDRLMEAIDESGAILRGLRDFNKEQWVLRYPTHESTGSSVLPLSVLRLELKLGVAQNASTLVDSLEKSSVGQLLDERMSRSQQHLANLRVRIGDTQSKVLVTGDLNAGKSTFINALLRRQLVPTDQQPCTTMFCEIRDAERENDGVEEVHVIRGDNIERLALADLENVFAAEEDTPSSELPMLRCFTKNIHATEESLLHNGAVDIALIDAPGLNTDSVKTTAVFAREEEIDVVVFVVNAENHFTLSACEFLQNASNEKAYVFVIVNKYDQIRNKDKCRRRVLEQIRELSPRTYDEANELVHFVDSRVMCNVLDGADDAAAQSERFERLQYSLRDFVLRRRAKSKLLPAQTFLQRLLNDVLFLVRLNEQAARDDAEAARRALAKSRPALAACEANAIKVQRMVETEEDRVVSRAMEDTEKALSEALNKVGCGEPAHESVSLPAYPGVLNLWKYAQDVRYVLSASLVAAVTECECAARTATTAAVEHISKAGSSLMPYEVKQSQRVFVPEAMFSRRESTAFAGLGVNPDVVAVRLSDLFDVAHQVSVIVGSSSKKTDEEDKALVSGMSLGIGALTLVGSNSLGVKTAVEAFVRVTDILGSRAARRWAAPVLLLLGAGAVAWLVIDLPKAVPRNVGRSLKRELVAGHNVHHSAAVQHSSNVFATMHGMRVTREVRKVLRIASWDLQEKFRVAIVQRRADVAKAESQEKTALVALAWFAETAARSAATAAAVTSALDVTTL